MEKIAFDIHCYFVHALKHSSGKIERIILQFNRHQYICYQYIRYQYIHLKYICHRRQTHQKVSKLSNPQSKFNFLPLIAEYLKDSNS